MVLSHFTGVHLTGGRNRIGEEHSWGIDRYLMSSFYLLSTLLMLSSKKGCKHIILDGSKHKRDHCCRRRAVHRKAKLVGWLRIVPRETVDNWQKKNRKICSNRLSHFGSSTQGEAWTIWRNKTGAPLSPSYPATSLSPVDIASSNTSSNIQLHLECMPCNRRVTRSELSYNTG